LRIRSAADDPIPKPLVPIGDRPILWHVMRYYAHFGHTEFVLCLGHGGDAIADYVRNSPDVADWGITLADTGALSNIGQRLALARRHVDGDAIFLANYADGLTDLHLPDLLSAFATRDMVAALLCTKPSLSYHFVRTRHDGTVREIAEAQQTELLVNGGYFVFRAEIFEYLRDGEDLVGEPFHRLVRDGRLLGYRHEGFWKNMDTFKDKQLLDDLYASGTAPWEVWRRATHRHST
jgi:glucose-1-phosphate cytidylyltransferase